MTETILIWLFGIMGGWNVVMTTAIYRINIDQVKMRMATDLFLDTLGKKFARQLHSPDDHLNVDHYLDLYLDHNYDMSTKEWQEFKVICETITNSPNATLLEKSQATFFVALCNHKLLLGDKYLNEIGRYKNRRQSEEPEEVLITHN